MPETGTPPHRLVDREHRSWMPTRGPDGRSTYSADMHQIHLAREEVEAQHGPIRPVLPITDEDRRALEHALAAAGRKAVYSLAVAVFRTWNQVRDGHGGPSNPEAYERSWQQMVAGRPGSWEAQRLTDVALWAGHGKPYRIHDDAADAMQVILHRWVTDPQRYTEVAATLAAVVSSYADTQKRGWAAVADQRLQPGALDHGGVSLTYGLLYSRSERFDPSALDRAAGPRRRIGARPIGTGGELDDGRARSQLPLSRTP